MHAAKRCTNKTRDNDRRMMLLKGWHMLGRFGHHQHAAKRSNQGPERDHQVPQGPGRMVASVSQEMRDGSRQPPPRRSGKIGIQHGINVDMPAREIRAPRMWVLALHGKRFFPPGQTVIVIIGFHGVS